MQKFTRWALIAVVSLSTLQANADAIIDAVSSEYRSAKAKARDEFRHPQQTLRFFGIKPTMTVVEIWPGGGWYTDILAPLLSEEGQLVAAHFYTEKDTGYYARSLKSFKEKLANHPPYKNITLTHFHPTQSPSIAPAGSVDAVLTFRNVHNWYMGDKNKGIESAFSAFYLALKPGGILGIVDHRLPENTADSVQETSGYMKASFIIAAAEKAGFKLSASSEINANSLDTTNHPKGVWTLLPVLRLGETDKEHYLSIGESDRMTLKFIKPE